MVEKFTIITYWYTKLWDLLLQDVTKLHPKAFSFSLKIEQNL